jgi:hypothetical protein
VLVAQSARVFGHASELLTLIPGQLGGRALPFAHPAQLLGILTVTLGVPSQAFGLLAIPL